MVEPILLLLNYEAVNYSLNFQSFCSNCCQNLLLAIFLSLMYYMLYG